MVAIVTASRAPYGTYDPRFPPVVPKANDPQTPAFQYQQLTVLFPIDDGAIQPLLVLLTAPDGTASMAMVSSTFVQTAVYTFIPSQIGWYEINTLNSLRPTALEYQNNYLFYVHPAVTYPFTQAVGTVTLPSVAYVTEDGISVYVTEDGSSVYVPES